MWPDLTEWHEYKTTFVKTQKTIPDPENKQGYILHHNDIKQSCRQSGLTKRLLATWQFGRRHPLLYSCGLKVVFQVCRLYKKNHINLYKLYCLAKLGHIPTSGAVLIEKMFSSQTFKYWWCSQIVFPGERMCVLYSQWQESWWSTCNVLSFQKVEMRRESWLSDVDCNAGWRMSNWHCQSLSCLSFQWLADVDSFSRDGAWRFIQVILFPIMVLNTC